MKVVATGLLVCAALVFGVARSLEPHHTWAGYVRAFAEASMVGALADWFAVTALFRHPLGLRIPHTAIIPTRKDDLGRGLGTFVQTNFLTPSVVRQRLEGVALSARLGAWLTQPANAARAADQAGVLLRTALEAVRDEEVQEAIARAVTQRVHDTPAGPVAGRILDLAIADGRHQELLSAALGRLGTILEDSAPSLRARLGRESPWWVPEPVDDRVFAKVFDTAQRLLAEVSADPEHELRRTFDSRLRELARELETSTQAQARLEEIKEDLLAHPALRQWSAAVWTDLKAELIRRSADPDSALRARVERSLIDLGTRLAEDEALRTRVDGWLVKGAVGVIEQAGAEVGELISSTVSAWDPAESTRRIELAVGRDLQFIRINGTVVGGLAGLAIYTVNRLIG